MAGRLSETNNQDDQVESWGVLYDFNGAKKIIIAFLWLYAWSVLKVFICSVCITQFQNKDRSVSTYILYTSYQRLIHWATYRWE